MKQSPAILERYRSEIDAELDLVLSDRLSPLYDMMRYHLGWIDEQGQRLACCAGKALRPTLCLLACESAGGEYPKALPVAASIELIHNYSLIHDDIQDDDRERRHRPTVWAVWGKPQAINAGTAMRILSNTALSHLDAMEVSAEKRLNIQKLTDDATLDLIEGQYLDISFEKRLDIDVGEYLRMIECKTASLIACSLKSGALMGTDDECLMERFSSLGWNIGMAFQVKDDILGIWGKSETTGKPKGSDILRRKKTLPVMHALTTAANRDREVLTDFYRAEKTDRSIDQIMSIIETSGAREYTQSAVDGYCWEARQILCTLQLDDNYQNDFDELIDFLEERNY